MNLSQAILLVVIGLLLALSAAFVLPFLAYFLLAIILAYLLLPLQRRLEHRVGRTVAAATAVAGALVVVVLPIAYVVSVTASEALELVESIREGSVTLAETEAQIRELTGLNVDIVATLQGVIQDVEFDSLLGVFGAAAHLTLGLGLTLFLLYYFLKDRNQFARWFRRTAPLSDDVQDNLFEEVDRILSAVLLGHVLVALVQGLLAGIGLVVTGVPNVVFWTVLMVVLSLLPIVGSFFVWGPAALYLFLNDAPVAALALVIWGAVVVGVSDDYLRPIVVDRYAQVNPAVIVVGVLGGVYVLGFMGIFFGPVVIGALRATLDVYREEFRDEV